MDYIDRHIIDHLQKDGRIRISHLAERIRMSPPQTLNRVRKLEENQIVSGYTAKISLEAIGIKSVAYVSVSLVKDEQLNVRTIEKKIMTFTNVIECHKISGDSDYLLKVVGEDLKQMSYFLTDTLLKVPGIASVRTSVCMEEIKQLTSLPLE